MMDKFSIRQVCFFFIAFTPVTKIFILPSLLSGFASGDLWISILLNGILDLLTLTAILKLNKAYKNKSFYDILTMKFGKVFAKIIFSIYAVLFLIKALLPIMEQKNFIEQTLYDTNYSILIFFPFFIVCAYLCLRKKIVLGRLADACFLITIISICIIFSLSISNLNISNILPIGISKTGAIKGSYYSLTWFGDTVYLLFFMEKIKGEKSALVKVLISYATAVCLVVIFAILFYATFSFLAQRQKFALIEISKYSAIISITGRFDYLAIFGVLFSSVPALILPVYFSCYAIKKVFAIENSNIVALIVNAVLVVAIMILNNSYITVQNFLINYLGIFYLLAFNLFPIILLFISKGKAYEEKTVKI